MPPDRGFSPKAKRDCVGKTSYKSRKLAKSYAKKVSRAAGEKFRTYKCPICPGWHLTIQTAETQEWYRDWTRWSTPTEDMND